jgi:hypothetical protein
MLKILFEEIKGNNPGKIYIIQKGSTKIGRKDTDINISDSRISLFHADLHYSGTRVYINDNNSTNGTYVNGSKVYRLALKNGDIISLGGVGEKASAVFKISISSDTRKTFFILKRPVEYKYLYIFLTVLVSLSFIWLIWPEKNYKIYDYKEKWYNAEPILPVDYTQGYSLNIAMGDSLVLPDEGSWKAQTNYTQIKESDNYENRITVVDLWNTVEESSVSDKVILASIIIQRFKKDFTENLDKIIEENFIWHEKYFLKENNIKEQFKYSKTSVGLWQWVNWQVDGKYMLYACVNTKRGRIILQASALDLYLLEKFFRFAASSYKEGVLDLNY